MGSVSTSPYTSVAISGYNSSPPPDDGSESSANKVEWSKHVTKLADPVKTLSEGVNSAVVTAFAKGVNTDAGVSNQFSGSVAFEWATATIGTDIIAANASAIAVGTESGATSDTLQEITATGVVSGSMLFLKQRNATEEVNLIHATSTGATATNPNIFLSGGADFLIDGRNKGITLVYDDQVATATGWYEPTRGGFPAPNFTSTEVGVTFDTATGIPHGLGGIPTLTDVRLRCVAATKGYATDTEILDYAHQNADIGYEVAIDATNITIVQGQNISILDAGTFNSSAITASSFVWVVKAWK